MYTNILLGWWRVVLGRKPYFLVPGLWNQINTSLQHVQGNPGVSLAKKYLREHSLRRWLSLPSNQSNISYYLPAFPCQKRLQPSLSKFFPRTRALLMHTQSQTLIQARLRQTLWFLRSTKTSKAFQLSPIEAQVRS